jgi:hypothetical protein
VPLARAGVAVVAALLACIVPTPSAPVAVAATVTQTWQARIAATNALTDTATIQAYDTGSGTLRIRATKLRASSVYTVTLYRGRCGWPATRLIALPSVTTSSSGSLTRNLALTAARVKTIRSTWNAGPGVAIQLARGSSKRCGDLGAYAAVGKATRLEDEQTHTVLRAEGWGGDGSWAPEEGSGYVTVYVRIKARTATSYNPLDYSLIDGKGREWSGLVIGDREPALGSGDLAAGASVEGWVTLMAPTDQLNRLTLAYRMNTMLHGPTLLVPLGTLASAEPPIGLRAAVEAGKIAVSGRGVNLQRLEVTLASQVAQPLRVAIDPGILLRPGAAGTQTMVVIAAQTVSLAAGESKTVSVSVACAAMHLDQPGSSDQFALDPAPASDALLKLLAVTDFADQPFRVQQFAIWTITDNPPRGGYVGLGSFGFGTGPSDEEIATIRQLFVKAGLDPAAYQALA